MFVCTIFDVFRTAWWPTSSSFCSVVSFYGNCVLLSEGKKDDKFYP